jgi:hypothetical protein
VNDICNKIKEKLKVSVLKTFIYADDITIWGRRARTSDKISPLGKRKQKLQLADKLGEEINIENERKNTIMKISRREIKQVNSFNYLCSDV